MSNLHDRLRADLSVALRERNRAAVRVLRTALSAIANAEAQPALNLTTSSLQPEGTIAGAAVGVGASEVARRTLDEQEIRAILEAERQECLASAEELEARGERDQSATLRTDAAMLERYING